MRNFQADYNKTRILVITGTTGFDSLIKEIDENQRIIYMINDEECLVSTRLLNRLKKNIVSLDYY